MDEDPSYIIILIIISLAFSAFFSGVEIAFISANRLKIAIDKNQGGLSDRILSKFAKEPSKFIGTMLLGNNVAIVIYGMLMALVLEPIVEKYITTNSILILLTQTALSTLLVLVFAEFLPKTIFRINPNKTISTLAIPLKIIYVLLWPFTSITVGLANFILNVFIKDNSSSDIIAFEKTDLEFYLEESLNQIQDNENVEHEVLILNKALKFSDVIARDCMVPRNEIIAFELEDSITDLKLKFIETGLSKILIYRETIDNIIGYVHSYEMFKAPENIKTALLPVSIVPESITVNKILEELIQKKRSVSIVVDEYGGTSGMITMEDIIEEIFGEIIDEHDSGDVLHKQLTENSFEFSGRTEIDFINDCYGLNIPESEEYETLAGYIIQTTEDIPTTGTVLLIDNFEIKILKASQTKIEDVLLKVISEKS